MAGLETGRKKTLTRMAEEASAFRVLVTGRRFCFRGGTIAATNCLTMRGFLTATCFVALAACAGNITPARQLDDAAVATAVREAIRTDDSLRGANVTVDARRGVVTLTGMVRTAAQRDRAVSDARSVNNVRDVNNLLTVQ